jgi:hypothetical protein
MLEGVGPESPHELRASDADREAAVGRLRIAAMEGRLDAEELATRVTSAYEARWCSQLERLTADVTPAAAVAPVGPPVFVQPAQRTNPWAIASLVLGLVWFVWIGSVAAIVAGHIALRQIRHSGGRQAGKGVAVAGLALGYLGALMLALTFFTWALN